METIDSNKLIASFMGARVMAFQDGTEGHTFWNPGDMAGRSGSFPDGSTNYYTYNKGYNDSWDWLMPVVDKIESLGYSVEIIETYCLITKTNSHTICDNGGGDFTKLSATYKSVVEFIVWYNDQK